MYRLLSDWFCSTRTSAIPLPMPHPHPHRLVLRHRTIPRWQLTPKYYVNFSLTFAIQSDDKSLKPEKNLKKRKRKIYKNDGRFIYQSHLQRCFRSHLRFTISVPTQFSLISFASHMTISVNCVTIRYAYIRIEYMTPCSRTSTFVNGVSPLLHLYIYIGVRPVHCSCTGIGVVFTGGFGLGFLLRWTFIQSRRPSCCVCDPKQPAFYLVNVSTNFFLLVTEKRFRIVLLWARGGWKNAN